MRTAAEDAFIAALQRLRDEMDDPAWRAALAAHLREHDEQYERWLRGESSAYEPPPCRVWPMRGSP